MISSTLTMTAFHPLFRDLVLRLLTTWNRSLSFPEMYKVTAQNVAKLCSNYYFADCFQSDKPQPLISWDWNPLPCTCLNFLMVPDPMERCWDVTMVSRRTPIVPRLHKRFQLALDSIVQKKRNYKASLSSVFVEVLVSIRAS